MSNYWTEIIKDISEVARRALHNLVVDNTPPLPKCYEREFIEVASAMQKDAILGEVLSEQEYIKEKIKTVILSATNTFQDTQKILQDFEIDAQRSLSLLEKEFSDINEFVKKIDQEKSEELGKEMESFIGNSNDYTKRIATAMLDIGKYAEKLEKLTKELDEDHLTGVFNRRAWEHDIKEICQSANRDQDTNKGFCVAMVDIDHFKQINDTYGHSIGDAILRQFGNLIKNHFTVYGSVYRYGGDEFAVIMPGIAMEEAARHLKSLTSKLAKTRFLADKGKTRISVTLSCGLYCWQRGDEPGHVTDAADSALYEAKRAGRNCIKIYNKGMDKAEE